MNLPLVDVYIKTNGVTLHAVQAGPEDAPVVILLHGFPEFWYGWRNQIRALVDAGYRVVVPDQRGYNLSEKPSGLNAYKIDVLAEDIVGLINALDQERVFLVGHDWGAAVAWQVALTHPGKIHKLVILNVPHPDVIVKFLTGSLKQMRKSWYIFFFQLPWLPEALLRVNNWQRALALLHGSRSDAFTPADFDQYRQAWSQPSAITAMINWYRAMIQKRRVKLPDPRVHVPVLVIWGKQDVALSFEMAQPSVDLCDDGRLVVFEHASHWVQHDEPERVNELLLEFVNS
jgi:pimeloyl-ACP methyl ester carboxylesterase